MNMETIFAAVASALAAIIVGVINHNRTVSLMEFKLDSLTEQVRKHNQIIERMYRAEERIAILETGMKVTEHRLEDLEENQK